MHSALRLPDIRRRGRFGNRFVLAPFVNIGCALHPGMHHDEAVGRKGGSVGFRSFICIALAATFLVMPAESEQASVRIEIGEPNIWSLEQAHYLLAKMRATDQALQNAAPSATDLDPNQIQATRMQILQSMFSAEVSLDQTAAAKNQLALKTFNMDFDRKQGLRADLDKLNAQHLVVIRELTALNIELQKQTSAGASQDQLNILNAQIDGKTQEKAALEAQISSVQTEMSSITLAPPALSTPSIASSPPSLPSSAVSKLTQGTQVGVGTPKLHASTVLDNYIQMQYEIIAKQLTLLREEVGPYQRLVFLELPYSIYTSPSNCNNDLIQIDWKITGYYLRGPELRGITLRNPGNAIQKDSNSEMAPPPLLSVRNDSTNNGTANKISTAKKSSSGAQANSTNKLADWSGLVREQPVPYSRMDVFQCIKQSACRRLTNDLNVPDVRVLDIVPRQSALNVNQTYDNVKGLALSLHFLEVFGMGGRVDYQRQRENYEQFVHQDMFATGRGKGLAEFGWTFGPLPGSRQVAPGIKTTYAILVVPRETSAIELEAIGYAFPRSDVPDPSMENVKAKMTKSFAVLIPPTEEGFYLTGADYTPAAPGNNIVLFLRGDYFSPQIGVLVNGVPLQRVVGIAQQDLNTQGPGPGPAGAIHGQFEQVNQNTLAAAFTMGPNFQGTPAISLVTPEKAVDIMYYSICINKFSCPSQEKETLFKHGLIEPMFSPPLNLTGFKALGLDGKGNVRVLLSGSGFRDPGGQAAINTTILINDSEVPNSRFLSSTSYELSLSPTNDPTIDIVMRVEKAGIRSEAGPLTVANPFRPQASQWEIISDAPGSGATPAKMQVHIQGTGLNLVQNKIRVVSGAKSASGVIVSATDFILELVDPSEPITVILDGPPPPEATAQNGTFLTIKRPQPPHITSIVNPQTKGAAGPKAGQYTVIIKGTNLSGVTDVLFGPNPATITSGTASDTSLTVQVPAGSSGPVPVILKTNIAYLGKKLDNSVDLKNPNSTFTYTDK